MHFNLYDSIAVNLALVGKCIRWQHCALVWIDSHFQFPHLNFSLFLSICKRLVQFSSVEFDSTSLPRTLRFDSNELTHCESPMLIACICTIRVISIWFVYPRFVVLCCPIRIKCSLVASDCRVRDSCFIVE